ncbi:MAG TPA: ABC transporter substrate-binding protein [Verrucomicrobiae bacterium]|nr:ABC transporter substrate-binding protein [Verrucomicrobiae bacterium]
MKTLYSIWLVTLLVLICLHAWQANSAAAERLRVGYPSPSANFYPLFATKEANLFEKYGFEPEMIYVQGVQLIAVHVAGQLDFSSVSGLVFLQASVEGSDLILLASSNDSQPMKLMVHAGISGPKDLKGKTVAVTRFGSLTDLLLRPVLKNWGLEPQKDVKLLQIGRLPDMVVAIAQKKVDGGVISFPNSLQAEKMGVKTLLDFADSGLDIPSTTVVASRKYANAHREVVLRFLKAYVEGTRRLLTDKELGIRALRKYGGVNDRELLTTTYDLFTTRYTKKVPKINPKAVETALNLLAEGNPKAKGRKAEEFMDTSFMDELETTGFIKSVWP